ncbi:PAAR-like protein [Prevotella denticola]
MGKEYIVKGAKATCKYGTSVAQLLVNDNTGVTMNGNRTATTKTLGNTFFPNFGTCSLHNNCPCTPNIVKWEKYYDGVSINGTSYPLLDDSVGTCASGAPNCISFQHTGQYKVLGAFDFAKIPVEHIADICPIAPI